jgi:LPLT family lysophospholipid transporter-like MFS transporter
MRRRQRHLNGSDDLDLSLLSLPMLAVLTAQFLSAFADNALLIAAIALVRSRGAAQWVPILQECFVMPFVLLAPFVGAVADAWPKGRVMFAANALKLGGAAAMLGGMSPLLAYGIVGIGAAAYSPAKYGILAQLFRPARLVKANGMLEGSTIAAILLGVLAGGWLADRALTLAFAGVIGCYLAAAAANLLIPRLAAERGLPGGNPWPFVVEFARHVVTLVRDREARFSLFGTSVFWGSGTALRLLLFAWVPYALGIAGNQAPANLMGLLSVGIVGGAAVAGWWIRLETIDRVLVPGLLLGPLVAALAYAHALPAAAACLAAVGFCGGLFVVPLNALLQERGHASTGAGRALAIQNFFENLAMLTFVGLYSLAVETGVAPTASALHFGLLITGCVASLALVRRRSGSPAG